MNAESLKTAGGLECERCGRKAICDRVQNESSSFDGDALVYCSDHGDPDIHPHRSLSFVEVEVTETIVEGVVCERYIVIDDTTRLSVSPSGDLTEYRRVSSGWVPAT